MACTGKYKLTKSENFEELMKALGVGMVTLKLGNKTSPVVTITVTIFPLQLLFQGNSSYFVHSPHALMLQVSLSTS